MPTPPVPSPQGGPQPEQSLCDLAVNREYCTAAQVSQAIETQVRLAASGTTTPLAEILIEQGALTRSQVQALDRALRGKSVIGGFEILEKIGEGGMGAVFRARQIQMDRIVALKILPPKIAADATFKKRFLREARLSAKLNHFNIVNGIDCGEAGAYTFFAMEFVDGETVRGILEKQGTYSAVDALDIIRQVAGALAYAQTHGLIHRDIKPDNIMITADGTAKLCDLGLAKLTEAGEDASLTQSGQVVGTPHYISPEQARGDRDIDGRTDIYSLGATWYRMLAGRPPFEGTSGAAVMALHITGETQSVCELNPRIPEAHGLVVSRMMAKDASDRYTDAEELMTELDALREGRPLQAARFRGASSCARPARVGRRASERGNLRRSTGSHMRPVASSERAARADRSARLAGSAPEPDSKRLPIMLGGGVLLALLAFALFLLVGGDPDKPQRNPRKTKKQQVARSDAASSGESKPEKKEPAEVANNPTRAESPRTGPESKEKHTPVKAEKKDPRPEPSTPIVKPTTGTGVKQPVTTPKQVSPPTPAPPNATETPVLPTIQSKEVDRLVGLFLSEMLRLTADANLAESGGAVRKLAGDKRFADVAKEIKSHAGELAIAADFEAAALEALAKKKGKVRIKPAVAKRKRFTEGTVDRFDRRRGVFVSPKEFQGMQIPVPPEELNAVDVFGSGKAVAGVSKGLSYLLFRGQLDELGKYVSELPESQRFAMQRKLKLLAGFSLQPEPSKEATSKAPSASRGQIPEGTTFLDVSGEGKQGAAVGFSDSGATGVAVGDINADGLQDLLLATQGSNVRHFLNGPKGYVPAGGLSEFSSRTGHICDVNRDGWPDLSFLARDRLRIYLNRGGQSPTYVESPATKSFKFYNTEGSAWMDSDGDGWLDFLAAASPGLHLIKGMPDGRFLEATEHVGLGDSSMKLGNGDFLIAVDLNRDTFTDFVYNGDNGRFLVALNRGGKRFEKADVGIAYSGQNGHKVGLAAGDVNNDGWPDIFIPQSGKPKLFLNDGKGGFKDVLAGAGDLSAIGSGSWSAAFGDLDLDGDLDLVVGFLSGVRCYLGDGKGRFKDHTETMLGKEVVKQTGGVSYPAVFDANADGKPDLFLYAVNRTSQLLLNMRPPNPRSVPLRIRFDTRNRRTPIGARVEVKDAWGRTQTRWVSGGDGRGGQRSGELLLGVPSGAFSVRVVFCGGAITKAGGRASSSKGGTIVIKAK